MLWWKWRSLNTFWMHCMTANVYTSWFFSRSSIIILICIVDGELALSRGALTAAVTQLPAELMDLLTRNQLLFQSKWSFSRWGDHLAMAVTNEPLKKQQYIVLLESQRETVVNKPSTSNKKLSCFLEKKLKGCHPSAISNHSMWQTSNRRGRDFIKYSRQVRQPWPKSSCFGLVSEELSLHINTLFSKMRVLNECMIMCDLHWSVSHVNRLVNHKGNYHLEVLG